MQETGNNIPAVQDKILSIRIDADGLYFYDRFIPLGSGRDFVAVLRRNLPRAEDFDRVGAGLDTLNMAAVPAFYFEPALLEGYLSVGNMLPSGYVPVRSAVGDIIVVMACRADIAAILEELYSDKLFYRSPLEELLAPTDATVTRLLMTVRNVYISVWREGLKFAQVLPYTSGADPLYYVTSLNRELEAGQGALSLFGAIDPKLAKALGKRFKNVVHEDNKR